jgi:tRNA A37 threonylcarbamoyladenosine dehydratase
MRHECKNSAQTVVEGIARLRSNRKKPLSRDVVEDLRKELHRLSLRLDQLFSHVNNIKNEKLTEVIAPENGEQGGAPDRQEIAPASR